MIRRSLCALAIALVLGAVHSLYAKPPDLPVSCDETVTPCVKPTDVPSGNADQIHECWPCEEGYPVTEVPSACDHMLISVPAEPSQESEAGVEVTVGACPLPRVVGARLSINLSLSFGNQAEPPADITPCAVTGPCGPCVIHAGRVVQGLLSQFRPQVRQNVVTAVLFGVHPLLSLALPDGSMDYPCDHPIPLQYVPLPMVIQPVSPCVPVVPCEEACESACSPCCPKGTPKTAPCMQPPGDNRGYTCPYLKKKAQDRHAVQLADPQVTATVLGNLERLMEGHRLFQAGEKYLAAGEICKALECFLEAQVVCPGRYETRVSDVMGAYFAQVSSDEETGEEEAETPSTPVESSWCPIQRCMRSSLRWMGVKTAPTVTEEQEPTPPQGSTDTDVVEVQTTTSTEAQPVADPCCEGKCQASEQGKCAKGCKRKCDRPCCKDGKCSPESLDCAKGCKCACQCPCCKDGNCAPKSTGCVKDCKCACKCPCCKVGSTQRKSRAARLTVSPPTMQDWLRTSVDMNYQDVTLSTFVDDVRALTGMNVVVGSNISLDQTVTFQAERVKLKKAIKRVLGQANMTYTIQDEILEVKAQKGQVAEVYIMTYPIGDLLEMDLASWLIDPCAPDVVDALISAITREINPNTWSCMGGQGTITYCCPTHTMVIKQTEAVQANIANYLCVLREMLQACTGAEEVAEEKDDEFKEEVDSSACTSSQEVRDQLATKVQVDGLMKAYRLAVQEGDHKRAAALAIEALALDPERVMADPLIYKMHLIDCYPDTPAPQGNVRQPEYQITGEVSESGVDEQPCQQEAPACPTRCPHSDRYCPYSGAPCTPSPVTCTDPSDTDADEVQEEESSVPDTEEQGDPVPVETPDSTMLEAPCQEQGYSCPSRCPHRYRYCPYSGAPCTPCPVPSAEKPTEDSEVTIERGESRGGRPSTTGLGPKWMVEGRPPERGLQCPPVEEVDVYPADTEDLGDQEEEEIPDDGEAVGSLLDTLMPGARESQLEVDLGSRGVRVLGQVPFGGTILHVLYDRKRCVFWVTSPR